MHVKRLVATTMVALPLAFPFGACAETETVNGYTWRYTVDNNSAKIYGYSEYVERTSISGYYVYHPCVSPEPSDAIAIPSTLGGKSVTSIGQMAFVGCGDLTKITVVSSIASLTDGAFHGCSALKTIVFNGNAPTANSAAFIASSSSVFSSVNSACTAYVMPSSTGWGVTIPGTWKGIKIAYLKSVNFDANGGSVSAATRWLANGSAVGTLPTPTRTGYAFNGWFTAKSGGTKISAATTVSANTTYYAQWTVNQYTVTFDANGGIGGISKKINYASELGTLPTPARTGFSFAGWYTMASGGTQISESTTVSGNATYYAHWIVNKYMVTFDANDGVGGESREVDYGAAVGVLPVPSREGYAFIGWYTDRDDGVRIAEETIVSSDATYYAHWVAAPYEFGGDANWTLQTDGSWKSGTIGDGQTSSMEMTVDGDCRLSFDWKCSCEPLVKGNPYDYLSFAIDGEQKAFICGETDWTNRIFNIRGKGKHSLRWVYIKDESGVSGEDCAWVANVLIGEIPPEAFGEYLNCPEWAFTTGGDAEWVRAKGVSADGFALRSGAVGHSQTSRLETVVYGAGTVRFSCKVDGEIVKKIVYDGLAFCVDGIQQGDLIGDADWTEKSFTVTDGGRHVLDWLYVKDEDGDGGGEDCAWLDCVSWTADDPLPALDGVATDGDAAATVAGLSDRRLAEKIVGKVAYNAFRTWVDGKGLSHAVVRDAPNAWLSYALDASGLMAKATPLASEDVAIESIEPSSVASGAFDLVVDIAGEEIGEGSKLAEALGVEGAAELNESAFSSEGLTVTLQRTADGKAKATVTPDGTPPAFFLRVKVK